MIDALIAYLESNTENFVTIDHAWETEPVDEIRDTTPALYLFPGDEDTQKDGTDYLVSNMLDMEVNIYVVCEIAALEARKTELRSAAIGWRPGQNFHDLHLMRGRLVALKGGLAWWQDTYGTASVIREQY